MIQRKDNRETIERWEFDVHVEGDRPLSIEAEKPKLDSQSQSQSNDDQNLTVKTADEKKSKSKSLAEIQSEIQVIIRQIIATVSFLPIPDSPRTFKVLAYTHSVGKDEAAQWDDSEAFDITEGAERVKLKSFSTTLHRVDTAVDYKLGESVI